MSFKLADFQACLNQTFVVHLDDGQLKMELTLVEPAEHAMPESPNNDAFAVVFQSSSQEVLPQQSYRVSNGQLGERNIFMVPIGQNETGVRYEAVFS